MNKIKVGVISFEHMHALSYTKALVNIKGVELVGIADEDDYRGTEMAARFKTTYYSDYKDLLNSDVDGVIVCSCNKRHAEIVVEAAKAKKHILVEKPFAVDEEGCQAMLKACEKNKVQIMTAFPLRFNQAVIDAKRAIEAGEIGEIKCITGINHGKIPSGWFLDPDLSGGGAVIDHTVHVADLMRWFTNSEVTSVYAEIGQLIHNKGVDDTGLLTVDFENGVFGTIDTSWAHHKNYTIWPEVYLEIIGTKGVLVVDAFKQVERVFGKDSIEDTVWGSDGDVGLIREFVQVLRNEKEPLVTGVDGARAMEIALAAYRSSISHQAEAL